MLTKRSAASRDKNGSGSGNENCHVSKQFIGRQTSVRETISCEQNNIGVFNRTPKIYTLILQYISYTVQTETSWVEVSLRITTALSTFH